MSGLTVIPLFVSPDHLAWMRWRIAILVCLIVGLTGLGLQLYLQSREEKKRKREEEEREQRQEERDTRLVAKVIDEYRKTEEHLPQKAVFHMTHDSAFPTDGMDVNDPRIYLEIEPAMEAMFPRTPFVLHNRGDQEAHKVTIQPFKLCRKSVVFPTVEVIPARDKRDALPTVEKGDGQMVNHDIFHWLMKDWNDNGELVDDWPIPIVVKYSDPLGRKSFEATMTFVFHPIRYMMNQKYDRRDQPDFLKRHREPSWEFTDIKFKRIN